MTRFVLCLGLLVAFGFGERIQISEFGTTAVAVWTPTMVVMAADGLVTRRNDPSTSHYPTCKTRVVGEYAVTAAGFHARRSVGFDVWRELERILKQANSLSAAASMVHSVVEPALKRAVDDVRVRDPDSLQRDMSADYLAIAVAGRDQAKPAL
jgi:hypothetical protein